MSPELLHYGIYFFLTLGLSTLFSIGGVERILVNLIQNASKYSIDIKKLSENCNISFQIQSELNKSTIFYFDITEFIQIPTAKSG